MADKQNTPMRELFDQLVRMSNNTYFNGKKSDCDVIDRISNIVRNEYFEKEKQVIVQSVIDTLKDYYIDGDIPDRVKSLAQDYYNQKFN